MDDALTLLRIASTLAPEVRKFLESATQAMPSSDPVAVQVRRLLEEDSASARALRELGKNVQG